MNYDLRNIDSNLKKDFETFIHGEIDKNIIPVGSRWPALCAVGVFIGMSAAMLILLPY